MRQLCYFQEASLKEFLSRPENRPLVEAHQRKEARQALKFKEKAQALTFREKVMICLQDFHGECLRRAWSMNFAWAPAGAGSQL